LSKSGRYIGSAETFVFSVKPSLHAYRDKGVNSRYLLSEMQYFSIGGEGDGPAIRVNETLDKG
jgi:hypothetical protein